VRERRAADRGKGAWILLDVARPREERRVGGFREVVLGLLVGEVAGSQAGRGEAEKKRAKKSGTRFQEAEDLWPGDETSGAEPAVLQRVRRAALFNQLRPARPSFFFFFFPLGVADEVGSMMNRAAFSTSRFDHVGDRPRFF